MSLFIIRYTIGYEWITYLAEYPDEEKASLAVEEEANTEFSSTYNTFIYDECEDCEGTGYSMDSDDEDEACHYCGGTGSVEYDNYEDMFDSSFSMQIIPYNPEIHTLEWLHENGVEDRTPNHIFRYALEEQGYF